MSRDSKSPGTSAYFDALQKIFHLESEILTAVLPHYGERGRNDEDRTRAFLGRVLPRRFSLGTGFVVCSDPELGPSSQTDIVVYDEIYNAPLHRELAAFVFPVEMVYGTVEVKGLLKQSDLVPTFKKIAYVRRLSKHKVYVDYGSKQVGEPGQTVVQKVEISSDHAPRAFLFAYAADWASIEAMSAAVNAALHQVPGTHLHGLIVVDKDWFLYQVAHDRELRLKTFTNKSLLRFTTNMNHALASLGMGAASIDRYVTLDD
jgi:hypothetical protein